MIDAIADCKICQTSMVLARHQ